ncbi:MAG: hypothetical protein JRJ77_11790 [Deltaproteobacteria bacterium]|nr:hypothetical protein [Deltaproteobacteria bacterium]
MLNKISLMRSSVPEDPEEFNKVMMEVDRQLATSRISIPHRPIKALGEISQRFSIPLPISKPPKGFQHESAEFWPVSERIYKWYERSYGDRVKMDFALGRMAILIEGDVWTLRFPRIFGSVKFIVSQSGVSDSLRFNGKPAVYNVLDAVENLPRTRIPRLPDNELEHIYQKFQFGFRAFGILDGSAKYPLIRFALADIATSVEHFFGSKESFGLSKWSSLQAAEKLFKAAIELAGGRYSNTHKLDRLSRESEAVGLTGDWGALIPHIQCSPGIRYGEEPCDRDAAIVAHHAVLGLAIMLKESGAGFHSDLSPRPTR